MHEHSGSGCTHAGMGGAQKPFKKTRGPARQASFARAKNDPTKKAAKQQETNRTVEWLMAELQKYPGYSAFRDTFHRIKHNSDAVRSWTFAVDFMKAYNRLMLVVSDFRRRHIGLCFLIFCRMVHTRRSKKWRSWQLSKLGMPGFSRQREQLIS